MLLGLFLVWPMFISNIAQYKSSIYEEIIYFLVFLTVAPGYFILPGVIKASFNDNIVQLWELKLFMGFTIITLGMGPPIVFFVKYEHEIRKILKKRIT